MEKTSFLFLLYQFLFFSFFLLVGREKGKCFKELPIFSSTWKVPASWNTRRSTPAALPLDNTFLISSLKRKLSLPKKIYISFKEYKRGVTLLKRNKLKQIITLSSKFCWDLSYEIKIWRGLKLTELLGTSLLWITFSNSSYNCKLVSADIKAEKVIKHTRSMHVLLSPSSNYQSSHRDDSTNISYFNVLLPNHMLQEHLTKYLPWGNH